MAYNGSGTFNLVAGNPVTSGTTISSSWANNTFTDIATNGLSKCLTRDGQAAMTGILLVTDGTVSAPGVAFNAESATGLYRPTSSTLGITVQGVAVGNFTTTGHSVYNVNVTSANAPVNGIYLPTTNTLGLTTNSISRGTINASGAWNIPAATAGTSLTVTGLANSSAVTVAGASTSGQSFGMYIGAGTTSGDYALQLANQAGTISIATFQGNGSFQLGAGAMTGTTSSLTFAVPTSFATNTWHSSVDGKNRFYFSASADTYIQNAGGYTHFRNSSSTDVLTIDQSGNVVASGALSTTQVSSTGGSYYGQASHLMFSDANDGWLRLNQSNNFSNGVYTPYNTRADGSTFIGASTYLTTAYGVRNYGSIQVNGAYNGYYGVVLNDGSKYPTFMSSGSSWGCYVQGTSTWSWTDNGTTFSVASNLSCAGNVTAYSDATLKTDVAPIENALDKVGSLQGVTYTMKKDLSKGMGFIAQEVKKVIPEVVNVTEEGIHTLAYGNMVAVLVEAVKELKAKVEALEGKA